MRIDLRFALTFLLMVSGIFITGCGSTEQLGDERFFGSWRFTHGRVHTIVTFRANSTWVSDIRIADRFEKIVDKKGNIQGKWEVASGLLKMIPLESGFESEWKVGKTYTYEIVELNKEFLRLKDHLGRDRKWMRVRGQKKEGKDSSISKVNVGPIVVNVKKSKKYIKDRYLCIDLQLILAIKREEQSIPTIHPKVREAAILNLSSLTYEELNTNRKIRELKKRIKSTLNPYMKGAIDEVIINDIAVTKKWDIVEEFLSKYGEEAMKLAEPGEPPKPPKPDELDESGESEETPEENKSEEIQS
jgi:flagellar basal body-associated protein FliL